MASPVVLTFGEALWLYYGTLLGAHQNTFQFIYLHLCMFFCSFHFNIANYIDFIARSL